MAVFFDQWFGVHADFVNGGHLAKISHSAARLYIVLCWKHDIQNSRQFKLTDADICKRGRVSSRSLAKARKELARLRMIQCQRMPGDAYIYTLCDVKTGTPYPGEPTSKPPRKPKQLAQPNTKMPRFTRQVAPADTVAEAGDDLTSFDYGFNQSGSKALDTSTFSPFNTRKVF